MPVTTRKTETRMEMKKSGYLLFFGGLALFTLIIGYHGLGDIVGALAVAGWGLVWISLYHSTVLMADSIAWQSLIRDENRPSLSILVWARWIGESVNGLLPVMQVGGDLARARLILHRGVPGPVSGASVVAGLTIGIVTQMVFTLMGVILLLSSGVYDVVKIVLIGLGIMIPLVTGFYLAQRFGMFGALIKVFVRFGGSRDWQHLVGGATALDSAIRDIYGNRDALIRAAVWYLCGWIAGVGEVWLALHFLGAPVNVADAFLLESLGQAIRSAAFFIPGALGVQEGGFLMIGGIIGLGPEVSLALSLSKRVRDLLLGLPGLIAWQIAESRRLWPCSQKACRKFASK